MPGTGEGDAAARKANRAMLWLIGLGGLVTLALGVALAAYAYVNYHYETPLSDDATVRVFDVPRGAGASRIADKLEAEGLIRSARTFKLVNRMRPQEGAFKAGEFALRPDMSMAEIADTLINGRPIEYRFTAPEGLTSAQIVRALDTLDVLVDDDPSVPPEGSLLPETYRFQRGTKHSAVLARMAAAQDALLDEHWPQRDPDIPVKTREEAIILASVVEKETGIGMERGRVAGVFTNRLRRGMRLQSDPTIIYGISRGEILRGRDGKQRRIYRSEIDRRTDWNTYQIDGLPKTPICNPGRDAILAVLNPEETDALYFVADGTGGHTFSRTLAEHQRAVAVWRRIQRERGLR